ncbi:MAG: ImmA/IrrE family metallo-endopeptidase [Pseudonocardiaceae bacterium]
MSWGQLRRVVDLDRHGRCLPAGIVHDATVLHGTPDMHATALLTQHWATSDGTYPLPVDPIYLARQLGMEVYLSDLDCDVSAVLVASPGQQTGIYLNQSDQRVRQRFSCAHEIGHFQRRRASGQQQFGFIDRRDHLSSTGLDPEERWANQFAAALLMPADLLQASPQRDPHQLARVYDVSERAMTHRLTNLGLINQ